MIEELIKPGIIFNNKDDQWVMKLTHDGILFNRERYPNAKPEEFAQALIEFLNRLMLLNLNEKSLLMIEI